MRGIQLTQYVSGPQDLKVTELPTPQPAGRQYLIKIHAAGTNFFDLLQIQGKYQHQPPFPWISGSEFSGTVIAVPKIRPSMTSSGQHKFKVGDRVFGATQGAYATHVLCPEDRLYPVPEGWSFEDAAGLYVTAPTSYGALVHRAKTQKGEWVLVHAGAGGVGLTAVQIAKALGATVIATASTERKREICKQFGADYTLDYTDKAWPNKVVELCKQHREGNPNGQQGVDVVYDPVGMIEPSLRCVSWGSRLLIIGFAAGSIEKVALNRVLLKNVSLIGLHWGMYSSREPDVHQVVWKGLFEMIKDGKLRGITFKDQKFEGLDSVPKALQALGGRETWGKVVITSIEDDEKTVPQSSKL